MKIHGNEEGQWSHRVMLAPFTYYQQDLKKDTDMKITVTAKRFHHSWHKLPHDISNIKVFLSKKELKRTLTSDFPFFSVGSYSSGFCFLSSELLQDEASLPVTIVMGQENI